MPEFVQVVRKFSNSPIKSSGPHGCATFSAILRARCTRCTRCTRKRRRLREYCTPIGWSYQTPDPELGGRSFHTDYGLWITDYGLWIMDYTNSNAKSS